MDNFRLILFMALALILMFLWQAWNEDYGTPAQSKSAQPSLSAPATSESPAGLAATEVPSAPAGGGTTPGVPAAAGGAVLPSDGRILIETDLLRIEIDKRGGDIRQVYLKNYPVSALTPDQPFLLMNDTLPDLFVAQSGLIGHTGSAPNHENTFSSEQDSYVLPAGAETLNVPLHWTGPDGLTVTKSYTFHRGSYLVDLAQTLDNQSALEWTGRDYRQIQRTQPPEESGSRFIYTYLGAAIYSPQEKYEKISFDDMLDGKLNRQVTGGWIAMLQHYFFSAWIPPSEQNDTFFTNVLSQGRYVVGTFSAPVSVAPGASHQFQSRLFVGPKLQTELASVAPGLELTVDYGLLTVLSQPLFWLLGKIYNLLGNWGWAIVVLTMLIKLAFYKLSETSYKSMANMRKVGPRLKALKDRYGNDKQRLNQAMMELYKKEKINPLGGCLPIVVQIPVFIALYWVLLESVELRQAPFILWLDDLSAKDQFFVLPVIMGISMFIQQKLNPAPMDPVQAKIMMALPLIFTVFFAFFPSGLVLYWVVNNILSIAQQWYITRKIEKAAA